jgi:hypothetical protein
MLTTSIAPRLCRDCSRPIPLNEQRRVCQRCAYTRHRRKVGIEPRCQPSWVLQRAAELVERGWSRGAGARDAAGRPVGCGDVSACAWDAVTAIYEAGGNLPTPMFAAVEWLRRCVREEDRELVDLTEWNDGATQAGVLAMLRRAVTRAQTAGE